jgi:hypothetical protein
VLFTYWIAKYPEVLDLSGKMPKSKNHQSWFFWKNSGASEECGVFLGYLKNTQESAVFMKELLV